VQVWAPSACKTDRVIQAMFQVSTTVQVGNGAQTLFWTDRWVDDTSITYLAPDLVAAVAPHRRKTRLVSEALQNSAWISDITSALSVRSLFECVSILSRLQNFSLQDNVPDKFVWKWSTNQQYPASSVYRAFFLGASPTFRCQKSCTKLESRRRANSSCGSPC
jgi:hypothetical protein